MIEKQPRTTERQTGLAQNLADACFDLRTAIRTHETKALRHQREKYHLERRQAEKLIDDSALADVVGSIMPRPTREIVRKNIRRGLMVAADTHIRSGNNANIYWQIIETTDSMADRSFDADIGLLVNEVQRFVGEDRHHTLFEIRLKSGELSVYDQHGGEVDSDRLGLPLHIVETCRGLYP